MAQKQISDLDFLKASKALNLLLDSTNAVNTNNQIGISGDTIQYQTSGVVKTLATTDDIAAIALTDGNGTTGNGTAVDLGGAVTSAVSFTGMTSVNNITFTGDGSFPGLQYGADYSTQFTANSIVSKGYVDNLAAGLQPKNPVITATTANLTSTYANGTAGVGATLTDSTAGAALVIDGETIAVNDRVLVKNQSTALQNGIYSLTTLGVTTLAEISTVDTTGINVAGLTQGDFFIINSALDATTYNLWIDIDAAGTGAPANGNTNVIVSVTTGQTDQQVSDAIVTALNGIAGTPFSADNTSGTTQVITITNSATGITTDVVDGSAATGFAFAVTQQGVNAVPWVLTRTTDFDNSPTNEVTGGEIVFVSNGTVNAGQQYVVTTNYVTTGDLDGTCDIGVEDINFGQFGSIVGYTFTNGLNQTGADVKLGGTLTENTDLISASASPAYFGIYLDNTTAGVDGSYYFYNSNVAFDLNGGSGEQAQYYFNNTDAYLYADNTNNYTEFYLNGYSGNGTYLRTVGFGNLLELIMDIDGSVIDLLSRDNVSQNDYARLTLNQLTGDSSAKLTSRNHAGTNVGFVDVKPQSILLQVEDTVDNLITIGQSNTTFNKIVRYATVLDLSLEPDQTLVHKGYVDSQISGVTFDLQQVLDNGSEAFFSSDLLISNASGVSENNSWSIAAIDSGTGFRGITNRSTSISGSNSAILLSTLQTSADFGSNSAITSLSTSVAGVETKLEVIATDDNATAANTTQQILVTSASTTFAGVQYAADYSTNFTARSLVDKGYVDGLVATTSQIAILDNQSLTGGGSTDTFTQPANITTVYAVQVWDESAVDNLELLSLDIVIDIANGEIDITSNVGYAGSLRIVFIGI